MSKMKITSAPFDRASSSVFSMQMDMLFALALIIVGSCLVYGAQALILYLFAVFGSFFIEFLWNGLGNNQWKIYDASSIITGILFASLLPIHTPTLAVILGAMFANGCIKVLFGGIGKNFVNPAAMGVLVVSYVLGSLSKYMGSGITQNMLQSPFVLVAEHTPFTWNVFYNLLLGNVQGSIGGVMVALSLVSVLYLLLRKTVSWRAMVPAIVTYALIIVIWKGVVCLPYYLCAANFIFIMVFMLTDPSTSPNSAVSTMFFGGVYGIMSGIFVCVGTLENLSCVVALLVANICVPLLEKALYPKQARGKIV